METEVQEVVSESSQNSVEVETSPEGNLTMAEFADSLLKKRTQPEGELEGAEGVEETAEQSAEESDPDATEVMEQDAEDSAEPPPETSDVLSNKFNVDLDSLSEEESTALAKQLNASAVKRFGKLTAQKKALAAENQALQEQAQQAQQAPPASAPATATAATGAAAETPHFSSSIFDKSAASIIVRFDNSSDSFSRSAIFYFSNFQLRECYIFQ